MTTKTTILFFLTFFGLTGFAQLNNGSKSVNKVFYNYSVTININGGLEGYEYLYLINHDTTRNLLKFESFVRYENDSTKKEKIIRTLKSWQLDSIYKMTRNIFNINLTPKKDSKNEIQFTSPYDGAYAKVTLNPGKGIDDYVANINHAEIDNCSNQAYIELYKYLEKIIKSP
jgi:hypothetical protein